jgi:hypothetical protein
MIYLARDEEFIKIGLAVKSNVVRRWMELQIGNPRPISMRIYNESDEYEEEKRLHLRFQKQLIRGEWFLVNSELEEMWTQSFELERKNIGRPPIVKTQIANWLRELLKDSPKLGNEVYSLCDLKGFRRRTLRRVAKEIGVVVDSSMGRKNTFWRLP